MESSDVANFNSRSPRPHETPTALAQRLAKIIHSRSTPPSLRQIAFGPLAASQPMLGALRQALDATDVPLTWVEGLPCDGAALAGIKRRRFAKGERAGFVAGRPRLRANLA